jgi:hypothetical protein
MEKRKAISKKLRFEIFKRDGFQCAYCGQAPPVVILEIDHIEPKSKGGKDDINNYITACFDCNRGKKDIPLDKIPTKLSENIEVLKEREDQLSEYRKFIAKIERREKNDIEDINKIYTESYPGWELSDSFKSISLKRFLQSLPKHEIIEALKKSIYKFPKNTQENRNAATSYFCGICWNIIKGKGRQ